MYAAGVVPDHSAQIAIFVRGRIWPKGKTELVGAISQIIEHDTGLHPGIFFLRIDLQNLIQVLGKINDHRNVAGLSTEACAATARQQRRSVFVRQRNGLNDIFYSFGDHYSDWHLAIVGAIHGVESSSAIVKTDISSNRGPQFCS